VVTTVILVRHAERLNNSDTTSLSQAGFQRADTLSYVIGAAGVNRIFVSDRARTQQTAAPTASQLGLTSVIIPANAIGEWKDSILAHRGDVILVVGHSDTVPLIIEQLGFSPAPVIGATQFDNLFVLTYWRWGSRLTHLHYGHRN
jgi:broad specificity phosphatase PhoE